MQPADTRPMTRRETEVRRFVRTRYGLRGTLALHRHALGWDLVRAPLNVALAPVFLLTRLLAPLLRLLGLRRAAGWLGRRQVFLRSAMAQRIEADLASFIDDLAAKGLARQSAPDHVARAVAGYADTRNAVSEITTSALVLVLGLVFLHRPTPGVISLAGPVAQMRAQAQAVGDFWAGSWAGGLWYGMFPVGTSTSELVLTGLGLVLAASLLTTFAGVIADPVQLWTGIHRRRIMRLLRRLDQQADGPALEREHLLARAGDLSDIALGLWRSFRG